MRKNKYRHQPTYFDNEITGRYHSDRETSPWAFYGIAFLVAFLVAFSVIAFVGEITGATDVFVEWLGTTIYHVFW